MMGMACVYGYTVSSRRQCGKYHPCPLLTPTSEAAPLGFLTVPTALSLSLSPTPVGPLFLLGHWGSLRVPGLSWGQGLGREHTVPAAVCVGAECGHPRP